jgi:hypothetical protein
MIINQMQEQSNEPDYMETHHNEPDARAIK